MTNDDLRKFLAEDEQAALREAQDKGIADLWWAAFRWKMALKGIDMMRRLAEPLGLSPEQKEFMRMQEREFLARIDEHLVESVRKRLDCDVES